METIELKNAAGIVKMHVLASEGRAVEFTTRAAAALSAAQNGGTVSKNNYRKNSFYVRMPAPERG